MRHGVTDLGVVHHLDAGDHKPDLPCTQCGHSERMRGENPDLGHLVIFAGLHQPDAVAFFQRSINDAHQGNNPLVSIVPAVEDQRLQRRLRISFGRWNLGDDIFKDFVNPDAVLGAGFHRIGGIQPDNLLNFFLNAPGVGSGQIDFIENRKNFEILIDRHIHVGQGLGFHPL